MLLGSFLADMLTPDAAVAADAAEDDFGAEGEAGFGGTEEPAEASDPGDMEDDFGSDF